MLSRLSGRLTATTALVEEEEDDDGGDDDDGDDVHWYIAVTPCYCSMLGALGRVESFEALCQGALLSVQITRHHPTIYLYCTEVRVSFC